MARPGMHKAEKRRKELQRQKKQEEKRKKRMERSAHASSSPDMQTDELPPEGSAPNEEH